MPDLGKMKKYTFISFAFGLAFSISSCDFVQFPEEGYAPTDTTSNVIVRKVLVEDYTGHKCTNCPAAASVANSLIAANGEKVIVIGVHAGFFANPSTSGTQYLKDFRTAAGTTYDTYFGISAIGNPNGMINRKYYTASTIDHVIGYGSWATEVAAELAKPALAKLEITNSYNSTTQALICDVSSTFLYDTLTGGPYKLVVVVTQDNITADQLDGGVYVPTYVHRHVLRDNLNGTWGEDLVTGSITANLGINKTYTYIFPATYPSAGGASATAFDASTCHIVAFIYNDATKEVIQVEEKKLIP